MRKILLLLFIWGISSQALAQQLKQVQLLSSQRLKGFGESGLMRVIKPVFSHEGSTLSADSANFDQDKNTFDAFGHVVITQSDGTLVYSDLLNYNGNTGIAIVTNNVKLVDKDAVLTTNYLTYNMTNRIGTYTGGGKIVNGENELVSKNGYYFANSRDAYFRYDVVVNTPQAIIKSDTLRYNAGSKTAYFYGPTNITNKKDKSNLYTENGEYNTVSDQARFGKNNLYTDGSRALKGDSLFYDKKAGYGRAVNNITFIDTADKIILRGNLGIYREADSSTLVTKNAYIVLTTQDSNKVDSIWMTADTLSTRLVYKKDVKQIRKAELKSDEELGNEDQDNEQESEEVPVQEENQAVSPPVTTEDKIKPEENPENPVNPDKNSKKNDKSKTIPDSLKRSDHIPPKEKLLVDTLKPASLKDTSISPGADTLKTRIVMAFHKVKIFKSDLQSKADSAFYSYSDSTIRCYINPMIWTQGSQLSSDTLYMQLKNNKLDNMLLETNGFIVNTEKDSTRFNQIKGKMLTGFFKDNKLESIYVDGNAESIYYTTEDSVYTGMNRSVSSRMKVIFNDNQLQDVIFIRKPELVYYPIELAPKDSAVLEGFIWKPKERPRSKEEIIPGAASGKTPKNPPQPANNKAVKPSTKNKAKR